MNALISFFFSLVCFYIHIYVYTYIYAHKYIHLHNSVNIRINIKISTMPGQALWSPGLTRTVQIFIMWEITLHLQTLCVPGLCTQNVTIPITLTSKGTPWIPTMQHGGWHFPLASSRLRQARASHFMFLRLLFRSRTAKKSSLSNSLPFWESRHAAVSSPRVSWGSQLLTLWQRTSS